MTVPADLGLGKFPPVLHARALGTLLSPEKNAWPAISTLLAGQTDREWPLWHQVAVTVTPEEILAYYDGRQVQKFTRWEQDQMAVRWWNSFQDGRIPPFFFPVRGSLGLYLHRGTANFQNVVFEPLNLR
jgi:hypothetical protein